MPKGRMIITYGDGRLYYICIHRKQGHNAKGVYKIVKNISRVMQAIRLSMTDPNIDQ